MVRADYRGDGRAHTRDGVTIFVHDIVGVNHPSVPPEFRLEAGWNERGAAFLLRARVPELAGDVAEALRTKTFVGNDGEVLLLEYSRAP
jgi:hypothetical protein